MIAVLLYENEIMEKFSNFKFLCQFSNNCYTKLTLSHSPFNVHFKKESVKNILQEAFVEACTCAWFRKLCFFVRACTCLCIFMLVAICMHKINNQMPKHVHDRWIKKNQFYLSNIEVCITLFRTPVLITSNFPYLFTRRLMLTVVSSNW